MIGKKKGGKEKSIKKKRGKKKSRKKKRGKKELGKKKSGKKKRGNEMEVTNYKQVVPRLKCFLDLLIASLDPGEQYMSGWFSVLCLEITVSGMLLYRLRVPKSISVFSADNDLGADLKLLMTYHRPWNA
ncbi:hypothetical protein MRB53_013876 [Persea americana]|uniref:Uncharacterized protein n=1 Tax=Persea americana TaxID=3435 RepID=A0ACC2K9A7_PERAE|nr:hypothetical protein MRB53_013876 [Persea americana]